MSDRIFASERLRLRSAASLSWRMMAIARALAGTHACVLLSYDRLFAPGNRVAERSTNRVAERPAGQLERYSHWSGLASRVSRAPPVRPDSTPVNELKDDSDPSTGRAVRPRL